MPATPATPTTSEFDAGAAQAPPSALHADCAERSPGLDDAHFWANVAKAQRGLSPAGSAGEPQPCPEPTQAPVPQEEPGEPQPCPEPCPAPSPSVSPAASPKLSPRNSPSPVAPSPGSSSGRRQALPERSGSEGRRDGSSVDGAVTARDSDCFGASAPLRSRRSGGRVASDCSTMLSSTASVASQSAARSARRANGCRRTPGSGAPAELLLRRNPRSSARRSTGSFADSDSDAPRSDLRAAGGAARSPAAGFGHAGAGARHTASEAQRRQRRAAGGEAVRSKVPTQSAAGYAEARPQQRRQSSAPLIAAVLGEASSRSSSASSSSSSRFASAPQPEEWESRSPRWPAASARRSRGDDFDDRRGFGAKAAKSGALSAHHTPRRSTASLGSSGGARRAAGGGGGEYGGDGGSSSGRRGAQARSLGFGGRGSGATADVAGGVRGSGGRTPRAARGDAADCALCGRRACCQPGACFCADCSERMDVWQQPSPRIAGAEAIRGEEQAWEAVSEDAAQVLLEDAARRTPLATDRRRSSAGGAAARSPREEHRAQLRPAAVVFTPEGVSCVLCGRHFVCRQEAQSSVLCEGCLG